MRTKKKVLILAAVVLAAAGVLFSSTINGITGQMITGLTQYGVVLSGGTNDLTTANPGTTGYPLASNGSSANPSFQQLPNGGLVNSSVTVSTAGCIAGGGPVSLGAALSLTSATCQPMAVVTNTTPGASPTWTLANGDISWTLSANATATVTVAAGDAGRKVNAQICQPSSGGPYTLAWPSNVKGGFTIGTTASKCSMQSFESFDGTNVHAVNLGVINQ